MVKVVQDPEEMAVGMKAYEHPPSHGLLFVLKRRGSQNRMNIIMDGVRFPLAVMFLRQDWTYIPPGLTRIQPGQAPIPIPDDTSYVVEIPVR